MSEKYSDHEKAFFTEFVTEFEPQAFTYSLIRLSLSVPNWNEKVL